MAGYPGGSEWRKWDLHVHAPGTTLNDGYKPAGNVGLDKFLKFVAASDVDVVGVTDYYSLKSFFACRDRLSELGLQSQVVLLPNIEVRLTDVVNKASEHVHAHIILRPELTKADGAKLLNMLETEYREEGPQLRASELDTEARITRATVKREAINAALDDVFGPLYADHAMIVAPANNDGFRPTGGNLRHLQTADEIDRWVNGVFAGPSSTDFYLDEHRGEGNTYIPPHPVFAGSDSHSFTDLEASLGKRVDVKGQQKYVTWIKADPTFEGLLQTVAEPRERVRIQEPQPDQKHPYHVIESLKFVKGDEFPEVIEFNSNLSSVIGPRSSGKSALLAYLAHAVDPDDTIARQLDTDASLNGDPEKAGPAAGKTWSEVDHIGCEVVWSDPEAKGGKVVFVPQNSLFQIGTKPAEVTRRVRPALFHRHQDVETAFHKYEIETRRGADEIRSGVEEWDLRTEKLEELEEARAELGDRSAVAREKKKVEQSIKKKEKQAAISSAESKQLEKLVGELNAWAAEADEIDDAQSSFTEIVEDEDSSSIVVEVDISTIPDDSELPDPLDATFRKLVATAEKNLSKKLTLEISKFDEGLRKRRSEIDKLMASSRKTNAKLLAKRDSHEELGELNESLKELERSLSSIDAFGARIGKAKKAIEKAIRSVESGIRRQDNAAVALNNAFGSKQRVLDDLSGMKISLEAEIPDDTIDSISKRFNRRDSGEYVAGGRVQIEKCRDGVASFLAALRDGSQPIRKDEGYISVAQEVLVEVPQVRFVAELDDDRIGGFSASSMTPGKQALFALIVMLRDTSEPWPLLLDQPEDDLDSRSISTELVAFLTDLKRSRQVIMVSHNANLVVGADSEQVIVANRHGDDRKNRKDRMFDYLSGSLENSSIKKSAKYVLEECGIREHACDLLDGGKDAFEKRRMKYKIRA